MPNWISTVSGRWTDSTRWSGGVPNAAGASATFNLAAATNISATFLEGEVARLGTLSLSLGSGSSLSISGAGGDTGLFTGNLTFDNGAAPANLSVDRVESSGTGLTFSDAGGFGVTLQSDLVITASGSQIVFDTAISGPGGLTYVGDSSLTLRRFNSFSGGLALEGGVLSYFGDTALGSGAVTISNHASFLSRTTTSVDNAISTLAGVSGIAGSARLVSNPATTVTFTGVLSHLSGGELTFGSLTTVGDFVARFSLINDGTANGSYKLLAGKLTLGDAYNAANLLQFAGTGLTTISTDAALDTGGFATTISNLQLSGGTIRTGTGTLDVTILHDSGGSIAGTGAIVGTAGFDRLAVTTGSNYAVSLLTFADWSATDLIELNGSAADNQLFGSIHSDTINGLGGNDTLNGGAGVDRIFGGDGNDLIMLGADSAGSIVHGGSGFDTLRVIGAATSSLFEPSLAEFSGFERIELSSAPLVLSGAQFNSNFPIAGSLSGTGTVAVLLDAASPNLFAKAFSIDAGSLIQFLVIGSDGSNIIKLHAETPAAVFAGAGADIVQGSNQNDEIDGGAGIDKLAGNGGSDRLTGGLGADVFKFRKATDSGIDGSTDPDFVVGVGDPPPVADWIIDYEIGIDRLNFKRIDTDLLAAGDQGFEFIGSAAFDGSGAAQIRVADQGAHLRVELDVNGDGLSDMYIRLAGLAGSTLTAADFVL